MLQQWLALVLNMIVTIVAVMLVTIAIQVNARSGFVSVGTISLMLFGEMLRASSEVRPSLKQRLELLDGSKHSTKL